MGRMRNVDEKNVAERPFAVRERDPARSWTGGGTSMIQPPGNRERQTVRAMVKKSTYQRVNASREARFHKRGQWGMNRDIEEGRPESASLLCRVGCV